LARIHEEEKHMALSLESIHQPLTDFFLEQYKTDPGSRIMFRFDKFGSVVDDDDFMFPDHPELGYFPARAREMFSELVNDIPIDNGDGVNILLSGDQFDNTYFLRLLNPAIPNIAASGDAATQQAIIQAFGAIKLEAMKAWAAVNLTSTTGAKKPAKLCLATPENWYDKSNNDIWTSHSVQVTATSTTFNTGGSTGLWKLKLSDAAMSEILQLPAAQVAVLGESELNIPARILELQAPQLEPPKQPMTLGGVEPMIQLAAETRATQFDATQVTTPDIRTAATGIAVRRRAEELEAGEDVPVRLHDTYLRQYKGLDVNQRIRVRRYIDDNTPTQPVETTSISISFDYCLVKIDRDWYLDTFVNDRSWCIPTMRKGELTSSGPAGNVPLLPIGFVAIRNLNIQASWTAEDLANAAHATGFGPFKVEVDTQNNKLTHPGLQIIGWVLQKMPDLPPNDYPTE
jgi:hypothetical protein